MANAFDTNKSLWYWIGQSADLLVLNIFWIICCIPVITIGPATAALYDAAVRCVRFGRGHALKRYWMVFCRELKTGISACIIWEIVLYVCFVVLRLAWIGVVGNVPAARACLLIWVILMILPVGAFCWMFPLLSRFTFRVGGLVKTGLQVAVSNLPWTILMVVTFVGMILLSVMFVVPAVLLPCLMCILWSFWAERAFCKIDPAARIDGKEKQCEEIGE